uniref:Alpha-1-microglobulin/bikunin precursor n=1 Tax=Sinocyclocheilus rhinocerous TaxID=307959 RepID=A0A673HYE6_9TELE
MYKSPFQKIDPYDWFCGPGSHILIIKYHRRAMQLRPTLIEDFKTLVAEQGMSEDTIVIKQNKGECVPGEQVTPEPQIQRARRNVVLPAPEEGSGDDTPIFKGPVTCSQCICPWCGFITHTVFGPSAACRLPMDAGPCKVFSDLWTFDSATGKCVSFKYGGCKGNGNTFYSQKECEEYCGVMMRNGGTHITPENSRFFH